MVIAVVGVSRAEQVLDRRIVLGLLIGVADQQADGTAGGLAFEHPGEDLDLVGFLALGGVAAGARLAPVQVTLQVLQRQFQARRAAVDNGDQRRTMAFARGGDSEQLAVGIAGHAGSSVKSAEITQSGLARAPVYAGYPTSSSSNLLPVTESNRHLIHDGAMMLRVLLLSLSLFTGLVHAAVLQRPVSLDTGHGELYGSLLLPKSEQPVPVVLIISGSGPTDRDGNNPDGGRNDSLKRLAWVLAKHNIASVRYDKRGVAASLAATPDERNLTLDAYVADAVAWGNKLKADPRLGQLIVLGHSEGALIATLAAPQLNAAGVISISGTARPVDQILRQQLSYRLPPALMLRSNELLDSLKAGKVDPDVPPALQVIFRPSVQPYLITLFREDPAAAFARLKMPALIIQGSNDIQVSVDDARVLKAAKPDAQLALIEGMNHVMRIVPNDLKRQLASYKDPQLPLAAELGSAIIDFIDGLHTR